MTSSMVLLVGFWVVGHLVSGQPTTDLRRYDENSCERVAGGQTRQLLEQLLTGMQQLREELRDISTELKNIKDNASGETVIQCSDITPNLTHSVSLGNIVTAVTTLGDEVFAVKRNEAAVRVYDAATLTLKRSLSVPGLGVWASGLVASDRDNCLYVSDRDNDKVFKVQLPNGPVMMQWNVGVKPRGLAINRVQNLIVNVRGEDKIKEYTSNGSLVRQMSVPSTFHLYDVAQLPNGQILVSNAVSSANKLAVIEADGRLVKSYTGSMLRYGKGFSIFENGFIIAADYHNNRMLIVNTILTAARVLPVTGLDQPYNVAIDESHGRVYIGELSGGYRLLMLENVFGRCLAF